MIMSAAVWTAPFLNNHNIDDFDAVFGKKLTRNVFLVLIFADQENAAMWYNKIMRIAIRLSQCECKNKMMGL